MTGKVPEGGLPDYNYETATEGERWAFDQGLERGHQEGYDQAVNDAVDRPEIFTARLRKIRP
jgi:flagellar biosynthesis/type III secretory pathway protein FliH